MASEPDFKQRGTQDIPYGGAQQLEDAAAATEALTDELGEVEDEDLEEPGAEFLSDEFDEDDLEADEELGGGEIPRPNLTGTDALIFGPSLRPDEPVTAGAPFGPGPTGTIRLDDDELVSRALDQMADRPDAPAEIKQLRRKFQLGV